MVLRNKLLIQLSHIDTKRIFDETPHTQNVSHKFGLSYYSIYKDDVYTWMIEDVKVFLLACIKYNIKIIER